ncbi:MAG: sodium-dependent transporter [Synergistetes bacterium]|nr:sodium-dependent transporter [Synergistota bacterium]MDW8192638.1 sodium-dependent transporter [Synergistota bacterium]
MSNARGSWTSRVGFIMAAAGSAIGLGNIWKFPYLTGKNGGFAFLIVYLAIVFTMGISVMLAEVVVGKAAQRNPVGAFAKLGGGLWPLVGFMGLVAGFIILSFYSVVAGWTIAYMIKAPTGLLASTDPKVLGDIFGKFVSDPVEPLIYHAIFMALTILIVAAGIEKGIEKWCKLLIPGLVVILGVLIIRAVTLPGALKGILFYLSPDFSKINAKVVNAALGQAFFSLSLGMGCIMTYASYFPREENAPKSVIWVTFMDTLVAFLAGLVVMPAVFAFGFDPAAGPGLTFITLPAVFAKMPLGALWAVLFFLLLFFAAITSSISILEVIVAYFVDEMGMSRKKAATIFGIIIFFIGIPSSLSLGKWSGFTIMGKVFLDFMDYLASNIMLPLGGIFISLFVGWVFWKRALIEATSEGRYTLAWAPLWKVVCRYFAPLAIAWILISGL